MPYIVPDQNAAPAPPGLGVANIAQGQESYRQLLTGLETFDGFSASFVFGGVAVAPSIGQTPLGLKTKFLATSGAPGNTISQTLGAELANFLGPARASVIVNAGGGSTSTAARFEATRGVDSGSMDFNPLNGQIFSTTGAGTKSIRTVQVDGIAWHEVSIDFGNATGVPIGGLWRLSPQIVPSPGSQLEFLAPGIMCMTSTVANLADVPPLTWIPDTGNIGVDEGPVTNAAMQGRLPALTNNPSLLYKKIPDAYQIEISDLGRILLCNAEATVNIGLPNDERGTANFSTVPTGWFCYIDCTEIGSGSCNLFDPGVADIIEPAGFDVAGAGTLGIVPSLFLEQYGNGGLILLQYVSRSGGVSQSPRWRVTPVSAAGTVDLVGAGTFTTPWGVRQLRISGAAGGGGGGDFNVGFPGGGGGSGDALQDFLLPVTSPGTAFAFAVGVGGTPGVAGGPGNPGATTSFGFINLAGGFGGDGGATASPIINGGAPGGFFGGAQGGRPGVNHGVIEVSGAGGDNVAGGIGGVLYDYVTPASSQPDRGGGGAGGNTGAAFSPQSGADGFLRVRW